MEPRAGLRRPVVMLVTDRRRLAERLDLTPASQATLDALVELTEHASRAGVDLIQVREGDLDARTLAILVRRVVSATSGTDARVIVNERLDVALACGAAGVHLPERGLPGDRVRSVVPPDFLIGRSLHDTQAIRSEYEDYLVFGSIFATRSKPAGHAVQGAAGLKAAVGVAAGTPVIAIGGIGLEQLPELARTGAAGIAAVDLFLPSHAAETGVPLAHIVKSVHEAFDTAGPVS